MYTTSMGEGNSHQRAIERAAKAKIGRETGYTPSAKMLNPETVPIPKQKNIWRRLLDFIEHPATLSALFGLGALVGTFIFAPFFALCAVSILFGFHRARVVSGQSLKVQIIVYMGLALALSVGGYFPYKALDSAVQKMQTEFAEKVANFKSTPRTNPKESEELPKSVLIFNALATNIIYPEGHKLGGINWKSQYGQIDFDLENPQTGAIQNIDLTIRVDNGTIYEIGQYTDVADVEFHKPDLPSVQMRFTSKK